VDMTLFVCHTGTDTWFALSDSAYIFDDEDLKEIDSDYRTELEQDMDNGYAKEVCYQIGRPIGERELRKIKRLLRTRKL